MSFINFLKNNNPIGLFLFISLTTLSTLTLIIALFNSIYNYQDEYVYHMTPYLFTVNEDGDINWTSESVAHEFCRNVEILQNSRNSFRPKDFLRLIGKSKDEAVYPLHLYDRLFNIYQVYYYSYNSGIPTDWSTLGCLTAINKGLDPCEDPLLSLSPGRFRTCHIKTE